MDKLSYMSQPSNLIDLLILDCIAFLAIITLAYGTYYTVKFTTAVLQSISLTYCMYISSVQKRKYNPVYSSISIGNIFVTFKQTFMLFLPQGAATISSEDMEWLGVFNFKTYNQLHK